MIVVVNKGDWSVLKRRGISKRKRRKVRRLSSVETMHGDNETAARKNMKLTQDRDVIVCLE